MGKKTTSSPVQHTITTTLGNGGVVVITSTSWVEVVPPAAQTAPSPTPSLQNAAARPYGDAAAMYALPGLVLAALLMV